MQKQLFKTNQLLKHKSNGLIYVIEEVGLYRKGKHKKTKKKEYLYTMMAINIDDSNDQKWKRYYQDRVIKDCEGIKDTELAFALYGKVWLQLGIL